ncbi:MAG: hypothetical protein JWN43_4288 [Gammaproteobacteria bacterium]|nr:hypothetical protein [Gammaproteobacteria bacterium]
MQSVARALAIGCMVWSSLATVSCGGGDGGSPTGTSSGTGSVAAASNVVPVVVDAGPSNNDVNTLFTTITLCVPGSTTQCQTIDHIQVDTGSYGLRILASVLTLTLPTATASDGNSLAECTQFVDGYSWGPISAADVQISGEAATSVPIQVIGASAFSPVPAACSSLGRSEDTVAAFGANGILGIGVFEQDCGPGCVSGSQSGFYYSCSQTACTPITAALNTQVSNPVPLFTTDNNGTIIDLPTIPAEGAATVTGSLIFGIDTRTNNASGKQTVLNVQPGTAGSQQLPGDFTIVLNGQSLINSFVDSGSNGIFFNDSSLAAAACTDTNFSGFYCPASTQTFTVTLTGVNNSSANATFSVGNAQTLATANPTFTAFPTLAGSYSSSTDSFDWGLPFYYGRRVATAVENHATSVGTGPYFAF